MEWIRFCMYGAMMTRPPNPAGHRHPQTWIRAVYPDATNFCPESICDAWFFRATPIPGVQPDPFSLAPEYAETPVAQASLRGEL